MTSSAADLPDAATIKACCADRYSSDVVSLLLGDSYHPGGLTMTRRLLDALDIAPRDRVLDVASGTGTSSLLAAAEYDAHATGVDLSADNIARANQAAAARGLADRAHFHQGDAETLPVPEDSFDAVTCECALCIFPDKLTAAREMTRALRPGGRLGITDVTADTALLPKELTGLAAWVACIADARTEDDYQTILAGAGLRVLTVERHDHALARLVDQIGARLELLRMIAPARLEALALTPAAWRPVLDATNTALVKGTLGYVLITAEKPCAC